MGVSCSALSDFSNFRPPAAAFAVSLPLAGLRRSCQAQSCWRLSETAEELERRGGKREPLQVFRGGGEEGERLSLG